MKNLTIVLLVLLFTIAFWVSVVWLFTVHAEEPIRWNCENIHTEPHPMPVTLNTDGNGNWDVLLADGSTLYGEMLDGGFQKWTLDDASWVTNGRGVVFCESLVRSVSILMAQ